MLYFGAVVVGKRKIQNHIEIEIDADSDLL